MKLQDALKSLREVYSNQYQNLQLEELKMNNEYEKIIQERKSALIWANITSHLIIKHIIRNN